MRKSNHEALRNLLRGTDGATASDAGARLGLDPSTAHKALRNMPDAYIDRWRPAISGRKKFVAIWCVVDVPEDCPMPEAA